MDGLVSGISEADPCFFVRTGRGCHLADDLTQETFIKAWKNREKYVDCGTPRAWLIRIADRCFLDFVRKKSEDLCDEDAWETLIPTDALPQPGVEIEQREEIVRLSRAMNRLSAVQRRALTLRFFGEMKFSEIADIMQIPLNTVLSHVRRGLMELRDFMGERE